MPRKSNKAAPHPAPEVVDAAARAAIAQLVAVLDGLRPSLPSDVIDELDSAKALAAPFAQE